ncbi:hypothetical protein EV702DRAFT_1148424 [Suillus placidus]|uniref:ABC transporter domain-containing protein n=1 Tax=Suillus placidus TaxID=48579 RepID=A0A9P6ZIS3_9AGAM|nr:hypothetical protein EV702DRAFT_1148424 [Suillus placidus]
MSRITKGTEQSWCSSFIMRSSAPLSRTSVVYTAQSTKASSTPRDYYTSSPNRLKWSVRLMPRNLWLNFGKLNLVRSPLLPQTQYYNRHAGNISFSYDNQTPALCNISSIVPRGGRVALVGESRAGKGTILLALAPLLVLRPPNQPNIVS